MKTFEIVHDLLTGDAYTVTFRPVKPNSAEYAQIVLTYEEEEDPVATFSTSVAASSDDATENVSSGYVIRTANIEASAIYLAGLRFTNVTIPQGATITSATLDVVVNNSINDIPDIDIYCQAADNAAAFSTTPYDISSRALTTAKGQWIVASPGTGSGAKTSPDFSAPLQELVNRPGWASGNAAVFLMYNRGSSDFRFQSYDTGTAATLNVTYTTASSANPKVGRIRITTKVGGVLIN